MLWVQRPGDGRKRIGKKSQLMPMILALLLPKSVQSLGRKASAVGSRNQRESRKGNPADADDAGPPAL